MGATTVLLDVRGGKINGRSMEAHYKYQRCHTGFSVLEDTTMSLIVQSPVFGQGAPIPRRHTGDGEDLSPPLSWSGIPATARELALIVDDPDAPTPEPWVHWVIYNVPVTTEGIAEGVPPVARPNFPAAAVQGKNSWSSVGYRGPAPPKGHGVHRYFFKLYALDKALDLPDGLDKPSLHKAMKGHIVAEGELMGTYQR
jgi:Raf kinase inhibitor-like YbhB/YbcL family protein